MKRWLLEVANIVGGNSLLEIICQIGALRSPPTGSPPWPPQGKTRCFVWRSLGVLHRWFISVCAIIWLLPLPVDWKTLQIWEEYVSHRFSPETYIVIVPGTKQGEVSREITVEGRSGGKVPGLCEIAWEGIASKLWASPGSEGLGLISVHLWICFICIMESLTQPVPPLL